MARTKKEPYNLNSVEEVKVINRSKLGVSELYDLPFGKNLREYLISKNCSQKELASNMKVLPQTISNICNGKTEPTIEQIIGICKSLGVSADYLLGLNKNSTIDENIKIAAKTTNLSDTSIKKLIDITNKTFRYRNSYLGIANQIKYGQMHKSRHAYIRIPYSFPIDNLLKKDIDNLIDKYVEYSIYCYMYEHNYHSDLKNIEDAKSKKEYDDNLFSCAAQDYQNLITARHDLEQSFSKLLDMDYENFHNLAKERYIFLKNHFSSPQY